jgi:PIN domain nuclease of toxin-antitoxin system
MGKFSQKYRTMSAVIADTHALIWYFHSPDKLSPEAVIALDSAVNSSHPIYLSTISIVEITYLVEKNKIPAIALDQLLQSLTDPSVNLTAIPLNTSVARALTQIPRIIVPEMGDRIIAATALYLGLPLVSKDLKIRELSIIQTIWDNPNPID